MLLFDDAGDGSDDVVVDEVGRSSCCFRLLFNESDADVEDDSDDWPEGADPPPTSSCLPSTTFLPFLSLLDSLGRLESIAAVLEESFGVMINLFCTILKPK